jgi:hypothetical protein
MALAASAVVPVPVRGEVEERAVGQNDDRLLARQPFQVLAQPANLRVAENGLRVGDIVEHDETDALVVERVVQVAEVLAGRSPGSSDASCSPLPLAAAAMLTWVLAVRDQLVAGVRSALRGLFCARARRSAAGRQRPDAIRRW